MIPPLPPDLPPAPLAAPTAPPHGPAPVSGAAAILPLSVEDLIFWRAEIERAAKLRDEVISQWDVTGNLERYTPRTVKANQSDQIDHKINVQKDFSDVERKKAALFYDTPEVVLVPDPGTDGSVLQLHQELLNTLLSEKRMDVKATVLPTIQDCLVALQPVPTEIGYTAVTETVQQPAPLDPTTGQPAIDPATGLPAMHAIPVTVYEEFFWRRISPKAQLLPVILKDTKYEAAPWIGYVWRKPRPQVLKQYGLPETFTGADVEKEKPFFQPLGDSSDTGDQMISGVKLWYRAAFRDPAVSHPEVIRELELINGVDVPVVHRNLPYQDIGPDGRLTPNSMIGYPDHPLALRDLTDSAYVAADCTLTGPLTRELNKFREDIVLRRDGSKLHVFFDSALVNPEMRDKLEEGRAPKLIAAEASTLAQGAGNLFAQAPALELGRESYLGQDIIERDRDQILGINAVQRAASAKSSSTATEIQTVQRNADARFEQERQRVSEWYLKGVQKVSALVLRYGDRIAAEILGPDTMGPDGVAVPGRGTKWKQARDAGQFNRFSFSTVMDSGQYIDIEARKHADLQLYNMTAKDPTLNRSIIQARLATDFGLDPARWLVTQPPEVHPPAPSLSMTVKPEDMDPALPSYVNTYAVLTAAGVKGLTPPITPPPPVQPAPVTEHQGMADLTPRLNQHQLDQTGERPGPKALM